MTLELPRMLLNYRILNNLNQDKMAKLLRCTQSQYSQWETGKTKPNQLRQKAIREIIK